MASHTSQSATVANGSGKNKSTKPLKSRTHSKTGEAQPVEKASVGKGKPKTTSAKVLKPNVSTKTLVVTPVESATPPSELPALPYNLNWKEAGASFTLASNDAAFMSRMMAKMHGKRLGTPAPLSAKTMAMPTDAPSQASVQTVAVTPAISTIATHSMATVPLASMKAVPPLSLSESTPPLALACSLPTTVAPSSLPTDEALLQLLGLSSNLQTKALQWPTTTTNAPKEAQPIQPALPTQSLHLQPLNALPQSISTANNLPANNAVEPITAPAQHQPHSDGFDAVLESLLADLSDDQPPQSTPEPDLTTKRNDTHSQHSPASADEHSSTTPATLTTTDSFNLACANSFSAVLKHCQPNTVTDYLILAVAYLQLSEKKPAVTLRQLNALLTAAHQPAANHGSLELTLSNQWLSVVPDLTGKALAIEYQLTPSGTLYVEHLLQ
jgi:hypothetical protein